ncbi:MAG: tetratricopeptide repeat protein [Gemmatimonadota bacterium]|nr:tetratricopeptide repeat protein [Gemmatimonadota bacterium]
MCPLPTAAARSLQREVEPVASRSIVAILVAAIAAGAATLSAPASAQTAPGVAAGARVSTVGDTLVGAVGGVSVDALGFIYSADFRETVYRIHPDGRAEVFATGLYGASGNAVDARGNLYQASFNGHHITRIDRHGDQEIVVEGLAGPVGVAWTPEALYVCNCQANTISRAVPRGEVTTFAESPLFACPNGITRAPDGNLYVVNFGDDRVLRVSPDGEVSEFARLPGGGNGHITFARGDLYATSFRGHRVYRVGLDGQVTLFAGTGAAGEMDGPALEATFTFPNGIAAGAAGDRLYINDYINRSPPGLAIPPVPKSTVRVVKLPSISDVMAAALRAGGIERLEAAYRDFKTAPATAGLFTEIEVNAVGYALMGAGNLAAAKKVFELNAESYPNSWNVWDSLAEVHMNAGDGERAIELYEKSLALNPSNTNATRMIARIEGGA